MDGKSAISNAPVVGKSFSRPQTLILHEQQTGISGWQQGAAFLLTCALLISRRPDGLFHAQFFAEDGHVWFAEAYNMGWWRPLLHPQEGYFLLFPRLGALLALLVPLAFAPLVMNLIAFAVQALPVNLLLSPRSAPWGSLRFRAALAAMFVALPNSGEISLGITESQWLLAFCAFLLLLASPPSRRMAKIFDIAILVMCGLTGPFCIFLLPVAIAAFWRRRDSWTLTSIWVLAPCSALQAASLLLFAPTGRAHPTLGASPAMFARLLGGNVYLGVLLGHNKLAMTPGNGVLALLICAAMLGTAVSVICFIRSGFPMRSLLLFGSILFIAALAFSETRPPQGFTAWQILAATAGGARYWFFPSLAFAWALLWCARSGSPALKYSALILLCMSSLSIPFRWRRPILTDMHYAGYVANFEAKPAGTVATIPENPDGWTVRLTRHASF